MKNSRSSFIQAFLQLPDSLPIFPLEGAVVFPGGNLPLNIFEQRYLNMVQDALQSHRLIGMIQPQNKAGEPALFDVGCAGRITQYQETHDGRIEIVLSGVCRFQVKRELDTVRGYRMIVPDWSNFELDYDEQTSSLSAVATMHSALRSYFKTHDIDADWERVDQLDVETQINMFASSLPLASEDKQLILETLNLEERIRAFSAVLSDEEKISAKQH